MAQNLYKTTDGVYILADSIEIATEKYKTAKNKDAESISLFQPNGVVIATSDTSKLTVTAGVGGTSYPNTLTNQVFPVGALVQFNAIADSGYAFSQWEDAAGNVLSASAQYNHVIGANDLVVIPVFIEIPRVLTTVAPTNGDSYPDYSAGQNFMKNDIVQFNAVPDALYGFTAWEDSDGNTLSTSAKYNHTMDESITIEAIFTLL